MAEIASRFPYLSCFAVRCDLAGEWGSIEQHETVEGRYVKFGYLEGRMMRRQEGVHLDTIE